MLEIKNIGDLKEAAIENWCRFDDIDSEYLNDAGKAVKEVYRAVIWHCAFHDNLESLSKDQEFIALMNIPNKHARYYSTLRMINRCIERVLNNKE